MKKISVFLCLFLISSFFRSLQPPAAAAVEDTATKQTAAVPEKDVQITVTGKAVIETAQNRERVNFTDLGGKSYRLYGDRIKELKSKAVELGADNLFSLKITPDGKNSLSCEKTQTYTFNNKNEKTLHIDAKCVRFYFARLDEIVSARHSDKPVPEPLRDIAEERNIIASSSSQKSGIIPFTTGEIYGKVVTLDLNSPFKMMTVMNRNPSDPLKKLPLIISQNTKIAKKLGMNEPINLLPNALSVGQEVTVVYARDELKSEALYITITKDR